jgi:TonB family protein
MFSAARAAPLTRSGPRPLPIALSILAHAGVFSLVFLGPRPSASRKARSPYDEVIRPHEHQLVWYSFRQKLPEVSPPENQSAKPPGAEVKSPDQTIVSNPKRGDPGTQMIWRPAPRIVPQPPVVSPNILAFRLPLIQPPPPGPPRKLFALPRSAPQKPAEPVPLLPAPPLLPARVASKPNPVLMTDLAAALANRPKARDFVPPVPRPERHNAPVALPEAPAISSSLRSARVPLLAESMAAPLANRPQPRQFMPPPAQGHAAAPVALPDAPKLAVQLASTSGAPHNVALRDMAAASMSNKPDPRKFVPPPAKQGGSGLSDNPPAPPIEEAPSLDVAGMPSANVNVAIVGLNPAPKLNGPLPETSRDARFSAGPEISAGNSGAAGSDSALTVPGLLVRGGAPPNSTPVNPVLVARAAPTSREMLEAAMKAAGPASNDPPSTEIHLVPPPDTEFNGRDVYSLAVQMPNVSSYMGSWIMWFAERELLPRGGRGLRPPVPIHKVDPKYPPAAISERIEGKVQIAGVIRVNGHVDLLRVLKGVDPRLDRSAQEALLKWEFAPAERNGRPVEVDLVAEIPFQLAPQAKR